MVKQLTSNNQVGKEVSLSTPQKEAVEHGDGPLLIAAGAGSGKTRTLTQRLIYLIKSGVKPNKIVAITFTNKAAGEMKNRLHKSGSKKSETSKLFVGTFHSFGAKILRHEAKLIKRTPSFVIFDSDDSQKLIRKLIKLLESKELLEEKVSPAKISRQISKVKNNLIDPESLDEQARKIFYEYENSLQRQNAFDFDDLIEKVVLLFDKNKAVLEKYQNKYSHILVDEYQDINKAQYELVRLLCLKHRNLNVVGDDQQSIYGFRWSDFTNFLNFERDWEDAKIIKLGENYRSSKNIVNAASSVIKNNKLQRNKELWTDNPEGEMVKIFGAPDSEDEANAIVIDIINRRAFGGEQAILYRTNAQSRAIEQSLNFNSIPYEIYGGVRFYERLEIKDILACIRYATNTKDEISLDRIEKNFKKAVGRELITNLPKLSKNLNILELIGYILKTSDYFEYLNTKFKNGEERIENIGELIKFASTFDSVTEFLERATLLQATDSIKGDKTKKSVKLMTIHLAKGLEFEDVYVIGMNEGLMPHQKSISSEEEIEEERRLAYVAMTRAKRRLYLSFYSFASRFLYEISPELIEFKNTDTWNNFSEPDIFTD